ncbi:hypothetical protein ABH892_001370 [Paenibacillus sp. RC254]|uniref:hypothetical protein n=1 Tax=unclassified Paenibacillus TaxID=185978 RepID=UPI0024BB3C14|nr:hypothetical protein [Paenibacillus sp. RC334]
MPFEVSFCVIEMIKVIALINGYKTNSKNEHKNGVGVMVLYKRSGRDGKHHPAAQWHDRNF